MNINYLLILVCVQCVTVNSRNYIIYAPSDDKLVEKKINDLGLRVVKSVRQSDGASQHILNLQLILPRAAPQETHNRLQAHSMAQQNNNSPAVLRRVNQLTGRRLAYKADLIEAFDKLHKRQQAKKCSKENPNNCSQQITSTQANILPLALVSNEPNTTTPSKKPNDLKDLIEIIKSGLKVNNQVPQTTENLSWMKIKVPKETLKIN